MTPITAVDAPQSTDGDLRVKQDDALRESHAELLAACEAVLEFLPTGDYPSAGKASAAVTTREQVRAAIANGKAVLR